MSNCSICGTIEYWHTPSEGAEYTHYCPNCNPPATVVLPLDTGKDWDIDESEIHGMPVNPSDPNSVVYKTTTNSNDIVFTVDDPSHPTSLNIEGSEVLTAYDELPDDAEEGKIAFKKGEDTAYVYDGEEWQNLGTALRRAKPSVISSKDAKCDRRAAIKATKAKNDAE